MPDLITHHWDHYSVDLSRLLSQEAKIKREESLARKTTIGIGGAARLYVEPYSVDDLSKLLRYAKDKLIPVLILGRGSNLIVLDKGVDAIVIYLGAEAFSYFQVLDSVTVKVGAGLRLKNLCGLATRAGLAGFEFMEGIPGNVGGALRMNAGAMGGWMFDVVEELEFMTLDGEVKKLNKKDVHVGYRHCAELDHAVALGAIIKPATTQLADDISRQIDVYRKKRHESQPREPSAGCIFKNPPQDSAGRLIDKAGLKGERVGAAEVSEVHANFIVNKGGATSEDVIALVRKIRARVYEVSGITLEPEVLLFGSHWNSVL
jgi:UDP-N-acetylenolpyruvoylglucosamine reductase